MPPQGWQPPSPGHGTAPPPYPPQVARPKAPRSLFSIIGVSLAVLLSAAALIVSLTRGGEPPMAPAPPSEPTASASTTAENKALCEEIAPLMMESNNDANAWVELGEQGTPASDAALPEFIAKTDAWVPRAQQVLDGNQDADPAFRRDLQRYIDDIRLYVTNVKPGPRKVYDAAAWSDSLVAYFGVRAACAEVGISWSR